MNKTKGKHLKFEIDEQKQMEDFIYNYKILFNPYKDSTDHVIKAKRCNDDKTLEDLKNGFMITRHCKYDSRDREIIYEWFDVLINVFPKDFEFICKELQLKQKKYRERYYYWEM